MAQHNEQLRIFETRTWLKGLEAVGGVETIDFYVVSGSRMLVTLKVLTADVGATIALTVGNTFDADLGYDTIDTLQINAAGTVKRVLSDYNNLFRLTVTVTGGNATYRVATSIYDNAGTTRIENAQIDVDIDADPDDLGHFDSIRIGDGNSHYAAVNPDGSLNVNVTSPDTSDEQVVNLFGKNDAVATAVETTIVSFTVPADATIALQRVEFSGENVAKYRIYAEGFQISERITSANGDLSGEFTYVGGSEEGVFYPEGTVLQLKVLNLGSGTAAFNGRLQMLLRSQDLELALEQGGLLLF